MLDLQAELHGAGMAHADLYDAVLGLKRRHDLHPCAVRPGDGLSLRRESERAEVQELVKRFRDLPGEQQRRLPALLNSLAQLEIVIGDLEAGQNDFQRVATLVDDAIAQAEARHNVYRAALEQRDWDTALAALRQAVALDPAQFEPFPFSRYLPSRILGAGAFGVQFLCTDTLRQQTVVVQALRADVLDRPIDEVLTELSDLRKLDAPALPAVADVGGSGSDRQRPFVVLEHCEGTTLERLVARTGRLAADAWLPLAWAIARTLFTLHNAMHLHRSLCPAAVVIGGAVDEDFRAATVGLLDVGLGLRRTTLHAIASHPEAQRQTNLGRAVAGMWPFLAPEFAGRPKGNVWIGPHTDVYSFGQLCRFALTGRVDPTPHELDSVPEGWRNLLADCTVWAPARRIANMGVVLDRLSQLADPEFFDALEARWSHRRAARHDAQVAATPDDADAWIRRGNARMDGGEAAAAVADFTQALALRPRDISLRLRRAQARLQADQVAEALDDLNAVLEAEPRNIEALGNRALALSRLDRSEDALADFTTALRQRPRDTFLLYNRGNAHLVAGKYDRAIADYSEVLRLEPGQAWAYGNRGRAYASKGDFPKAIADFSRVLQLDPANVKALHDRAQAYEADGNLDAAVADLDALLRLAPSDVFYIERGILQVSRGALDEAIADFTQAIQLAPDSAEAFACRGNARAEQGDRTGALADFDSAVRLEPEDPRGWYNRGNTKARCGDLAGAIADYTQALELDPTYLAALFNRGNAFADSGDIANALADFDRYLEHGPHAGAFTNRGNAHCALGQDEAALADYQAALALEPQDVLTLLNRASLLADRGDLEAALADYTAALAVESDDPRVFCNRGLVQVGLGRTTDALADFAEAIRRNPELAAPYLHRARLLEELGDLEAALADYDRAAALAPESAEPFFGRGNTQAARGNLEAALADLNRVLELDPCHAGTLNNRGHLQQRLGNTDAALADFNAAVAANPQFVLAWFNKGNLHAERGEFAAALDAFNRVAELGAVDQPMLHNRGRVLALLGRFSEAVRDYTEAQERSPDDPRTCNNLAWILATCPDDAVRNGPRAVELARRACELTQWQDPGLLDTLAASYAAAGRFEDAIAMQRRAIELVEDSQKPDYRSRLAQYEAGSALRDGKMG